MKRVYGHRSNNGGAAVGDYLSSTTTAAAYVDPVIPAASIEGQSKVTAKWDESLSNEEKFAKIATQRWIAIYPEGMNGWAEIRRNRLSQIIPGNGELQSR